MLAKLALYTSLAGLAALIPAASIFVVTGLIATKWVAWLTLYFSTQFLLAVVIGRAIRRNHS